METEREKFRAYVEKSGLMSALTNVLVTLYEEPDKPKDALNYVIASLGCHSPEQKHIEILEKKCKELEEENTKLKEQLLKLSAGNQEDDEHEKSVETESTKEES